MKSIGKVLYGLYARVARLVFYRTRKAVYIALSGGPGAGKGTVAKVIAPRIGLKHLNMGEVIRREIDDGTPFGRKWGPVVRSGKLIPGKHVLKLAKRELLKPEYAKGALLDGVPRTLVQAKQFDHMLMWRGQHIHFCVYLDVRKEDLIERLSGRRTCTNPEGTHTVNLNLEKLAQDGKCNHCGFDLVQRADDRPEIIVARMQEFESTFTGVREYFSGRIAVVQSTNQMTPQDVIDRVYSEIEEAEW